ncbi:MAG: alpha/beta hydrolase, partial [Bosea sp. (in: a-proteobacteria)]
MNAIDYEAEYNNRARVPEHPAIMAGWAEDAAAFRAAQGSLAELGLSYGPSPRQYFDLFKPQAQAGDALVMFIHGGYWQALEPSSFSHCAKGLVARGVPVAVAGYDLCPAVSVEAIIMQMRACAADLWRRYATPIIACGHSAGGQLAACLVATNWSEFAPDLPPRLVRAGLGISGVYNLRPLIETSINDKLKLDDTTSRAVSPLFWPAPPNATFEAWVGADESGQYLRQSKALVEAWSLGGALMSYAEIPAANHFTAIAPLAEPHSEMV